MNRLIVLGAGNVGRYAANLLQLAGHEVTVADISEENLALARRHGVDTMQIDISDPDTGIYPMCALYDGVLNCVPGSIALEVQKGLITAGCPIIVDTTFGMYDMNELHELCRRPSAARSVVFVPDMGIAPGVSNLLVAEARALLPDQADKMEVYVGGLPFARLHPWEYQTAFNVRDTMAEYERPARVIRNRGLAELPAMSEVKTIEAPAVGTLEAFLSDGLRTLALTQQGLLNSLTEYTLRYPGHINQVLGCMKAGMWTEEYLREAWAPQSTSTFVYLEVRGSSATRDIKLSVAVKDNEVADSMAVATATPAATALDVLLTSPQRENMWGVYPPEQLTRKQREKILRDMSSLGVCVETQIEARPDS